MTTPKASDIRQALDSGNDNIVSDALKAIKAGTKMSLIKAVFTGLTDVAAQDITTAAAKAAATITGITLATGENLPAIGQVVTLRTTAGTMASHGPCIPTDASGTAAAPGGAIGVALLSNDGTTLTFQAGVTAFVLEYYPREYQALNTAFPMASP